ncbi:DNA-directed RNA polymerase I [Histoplasma capsulatum H143]|uniref:DNA-directed RNA polymerase subunit n=1 Tax=Ajellomyces capsulatus (strain H143) TaxID=544712 RepID=C6HCI4_AJECH|nr:DNA-directed RNA polymerase I [Histoplasma capsulatum H143]
MASFTRPISSSIEGVDFRVLSNEEIKTISVKLIYNTPTLDSLNNPVPGGLYDPALGAWGDHICTTCRLNSWSCNGHAGHIELPVHVYNVTFFDQLFRLLRAQCVYCHRFRMSRADIMSYTCKLRLLQYGLVEEAAAIDSMEIRRGKGNAGSESGDSEDEDEEDLVRRRDVYVKRCIHQVLARNKEGNFLHGTKNPVAAEQRRNIVRAFLKDITAVKKCASCSGISPPFRRDKYSKIFKKPLPQKAKVAMSEAGFHVPNPLLLIKEANDLSKKHGHQSQGSNMNGYLEDDDDDASVSTDLHGAEQQITMGNAVLTQVEERGSRNNPSEQGAQQFMPSPEVYAALRLLFEKEQEVLDLVYDSRPKSNHRPRVTPDMFFIKNILVPPNKYRPIAASGSNDIIEAQQNISFTRIMKLCDQINQISRERQGDSTESVTRLRDYRDLLQAIVQLQDAVNSLIDRDRNPNQGAAGIQNEDGIKQRLEKKDGLFRKNMMGKRVNFAARSVISPDPNIETNEIGVPLVFAKKLTYPEPVTNHNYWELKNAVINGPDVYPGAAAVENEVGQVVSLKFKSQEERLAIANMLLSPSNFKMKRSRSKKVYRHLTTGDVVIMNRQPTLHKPSIMGHRARVLTGERTIRMHYANCKTYNADFDGDEMNLHFPQNELARVEAMQLADTDHQYLSATAGKPLRGLIQDHISMGTWFTSRDTFFDKDDYYQLLYNCLRPENSHTVTDKILLMKPAILRPRKLWTGKQVISTIMMNITPERFYGLNLTGKSRTPGDRWGEGSEEGQVIFRDGELLCGILDSAQLGPSPGGLIHSVHEIYGHVVAGKLLGVLGRLLTKFLHMRAFTCGIDDLRLTKKGNEDRRKKLQEAEHIGRHVALKYVTLDQTKFEDEEAELKRRLEDALRDDEKQAGLDAVLNSQAADISSDITAACLPVGLEKPFPWNQMQTMTTSGAKGSVVNANLISCNLGQQVLEGRRVPVMISGKTLPSFRPFDTNLMASGFVSGRFLTGIKPQEYYFHAMAGREGLIDTAVKTSRSGYLQRCLIKGMEGLKAEYDNSVRETTDGSVMQFLYGEDGLEITKQKHLQDFPFLAHNFWSVVEELNGSDEFNRVKSDKAGDWNRHAIKKYRKTGKLDCVDPALSLFPPGSCYGSTSETFAMALKLYQKDNPDQILKEKGKVEKGISKKDFARVMNLKYMRSVVEPGESVGIVAGQSIGEPSTQMTLNTFHLAGHSAKNVTLGIPRLREIVMTASNQILTPTMTSVLRKELTEKDGRIFAKAISKLTIAEVVDTLRVHERVSSGSSHGMAKIYDLEIDFFPPEEYTEEYAIQIEDIFKTLQHKFVPRLIKLTRAELKKRTDEKSLSAFSAAQPDIGISTGVVEEPTRRFGHEARDADADDDDEEDQDDAKRAMSHMNHSNQVSYEAPDDGEEDIIRGQEPDSDSDEETDGNHHGSMLRLRIKQSEDTITGKYAEITKFKFSLKKGKSCHIQLRYDISTPKLLLLPLVEDAARTSVIQFIKGLGACSYIEADRENPAHIVTDGVNLLAMREYQDFVYPHSLYTNSIADMLVMYGVEAARACIIREMAAVFDGHSISVDNRHLNLIGDVMTHAGSFRAFNRMGLVKDSTSPFMKMSFETTVGFLRDAVLERDCDNLNGPSSRIVMGRVGTVGTGAFDVLAPVG